MIIKLPMILKSLGPSFWLLQFCLSYNHRNLWKLWTRINFSTAKSGFFYGKNIKDYKDHVCMEITPPPKKKKEPCSLDLRLFLFIQQIV